MLQPMRDRRRLPPQPLPRAPLWRRAAATALDALLAGLLGSLLGSGLQGVVFGVVWLALRVVMPANNRGQSLGRLAMDVKLIDERSRRIPTLLELFKREAIVGLEALWAWYGLGLLLAVNPLALLSIAPALADGAVAALDDDRRQTFHDRLVGTTVIQTQRGFSLDLKLKRLWQSLSVQGDRLLQSTERWRNEQREEGRPRAGRRAAPSRGDRDDRYYGGAIDDEEDFEEEYERDPRAEDRPLRPRDRRPRPRRDR